MRKYVIVNMSSSIVEQIMRWGDNRDFPSDFPLNEGCSVVTVDNDYVIELGDVYDTSTNEFYILDITDNEIELSELKSKLQALELELPESLEVTWSATVGFDENRLPMEWLSRLNQKRSIREQIRILGGV